MTNIPAWLTVGAIARDKASNRPLKVLRVGDTIDARTARASDAHPDFPNADPAAFAPASIEDRILFVLDEARIAEIDKIIPEGKSEDQFRVVFRSHIPDMVIKKISALSAEGVFADAELDDNAFVITVRMAWVDDLVLADPVTPALLAMAEAEAAVVAQQAAKALNPAIVDKIIAELSQPTVHCDMTGVHIVKGQSNSEYTVRFPTVNQIKLPAVQIKKRCQFLRVEQINNILVVTIPSLWEVKEAIASQPAAPVEPDDEMTEVERWREADEASALADSLIEDESQAENARIIQELRERNARLQARNEALAEQVDSLIGHIDGAALHTEDTAERHETPIPTGQLATCKEWDIELSASIATLNTRESQGWEVAHMEFELGKLNVVYYRVQSAPAPTNGTATTARLLTPVGPHVIIGAPQPDTHGALHRKPVPTVTLNKQGAPPIRYEQIAADRVRLQALVNDPDVTDFDFSLAVEQSCLPRDERNALIRQYRNHLGGQRLAAQMDQMPRPSAQRPFVSLGEVQR